jgi:hypothetical protein
MFGVPRRHDALSGHARDLLRALRHVLVGDQRKRRNLAGAVTGDAVGVDDWRDVFGEGHRRRALLRSLCRCGDEGNCEEQGGGSVRVFHSRSFPSFHGGAM